MQNSSFAIFLIVKNQISKSTTQNLAGYLSKSAGYLFKNHRGVFHLYVICRNYFVTPIFVPHLEHVTCIGRSVVLISFSSPHFGHFT